MWYIELTHLVIENEIIMPCVYYDYCTSISLTVFLLLSLADRRREGYTFRAFSFKFYQACRNYGLRIRIVNLKKKHFALTRKYAIFISLNCLFSSLFVLISRCPQIQRIKTVTTHVNDLNWTIACDRDDTLVVSLLSQHTDVAVLKDSLYWYYNY